MKQETLIAGFGGQGILLIGQLLAEAAMRQGLPNACTRSRKALPGCQIWLSYLLAAL